MIDCDDYFGGLTREEYEKETEEHFKFIDHICKCDYDKAFSLSDNYKDNLFASEFVSDEEAEMLYHTILNWKEKSEMYDDLKHFSQERLISLFLKMKKLFNKACEQCDKLEKENIELTDLDKLIDEI